jgi:hypothetical protein
MSDEGIPVLSAEESVAYRGTLRDEVALHLTAEQKNEVLWKCFDAVLDNDADDVRHIIETIKEHYPS